MIIQDSIYDDWMPILGAMVVGVYGAICRLSEKQDEVRVRDLGAICRVHGQTLALICNKLASCGLVVLDCSTAHLDARVSLLPVPVEVSLGEPVTHGASRLLPEK